MPAAPKPHVLVGRNLHRLRLRAGLTQEQLAEFAGVDLRSLQRIEAGAWNMTIDYLARFQRPLACKWRELVEGLDASTLPAPPPSRGGRMPVAGAKVAARLKARRRKEKWAKGGEKGARA